VPVVAGAGDEVAAGLAGRGQFRASHADREQVIELLKNAFVQGRLAQDELDTRVGLALASRTYAELATVTADIPGSAVVAPAAEPAGTPARTLAKAALRSGICLLVAFALVGVAVLTKAESMTALAFFSGVAAVIAASGFLGYGVVDAWQERRSRGQLPPRRRDGRGLEGGRSGTTGRDPGLPGVRPGQTRADLRTDRPGRDRRHPSGRVARTPRGIRPAPGAA
jgi:hypothetical protein